MDPSGRRLPVVAALLIAVALALAGCSSTRDADADAGVPRTDVVSAIAADPAAIALLPAATRQAGVLSVAATVAAPPTAFHLSDNRTAVGIDIDMVDAVAHVLGLRVARSEARFETILPGLASGKFDLGTGNFAVTEARKRIVDFVTYINDGQGFMARVDDPQPPITDLTALCGKTVGTGAGTTFETALDAASPRCAALGRPPITVSSYTDNATVFLSLVQRRTDVVMSTINGLRYIVAQQPAKLRYVDDFRRLDVGFALAKNSALTPAVHAAMTRLMADGTYQRILAKWGVASSAIPTSEIDPPESA